MLPLMEMLTQGANGRIIDQLASQYGLTTQQTVAAMEALMPAFSQGLKRNTADPYGFLAFMKALSSGQHTAYYENPSQAFGANGIEEGNAILGHLFGSKELSRAVAEQAAQVTGLSQSVLKSMLPALAPMILGGLYKQMNAAQPSPAQAAMGNNPLGQILEQMLGGQSGSASSNPWGKMMEEMLGGGRQPTGRQPTGQQAPHPGAANPWGEILEQMLGGKRPPAGRREQDDEDDRAGRGGRDSEDIASAARGAARAGGAIPRGRRDDDAPETPRKGGYDDLFGEMFDTGRKVQKDYHRNMESIFDQFLEGMRKR